MQGSWYKYFLKFLRFYYRFKRIFLFLLKIILLIKILSISLDIYSGYFPNIFNNIVLIYYFDIYYNLWYLYFIYWYKVFWIFFLFIIVFFYFFFRIGLIDTFEIKKRLKIKEQQLKNSEDKLNKKFYIINIQQKKVVLKKKLKKLKTFLSKYL